MLSALIPHLSAADSANIDHAMLQFCLSVAGFALLIVATLGRRA
jgi:hypothetical protein